MSYTKVFVVTQLKWYGAAGSGWVENIFGVYSTLLRAKQVTNAEWRWASEDKVWVSHHEQYDDYFCIQECPLNEPVTKTPPKL